MALRCDDDELEVLAWFVKECLFLCITARCDKSQKSRLGRLRSKPACGSVSCELGVNVIS